MNGRRRRRRRGANENFSLAPSFKRVRDSTMQKNAEQAGKARKKWPSDLKKLVFFELKFCIKIGFACILLSLRSKPGRGGGACAAGRRNFHGSPISEAPSPFSVSSFASVFCQSSPSLPYALRYPRPTNNDVEKKRSRLFYFGPLLGPAAFQTVPRRNRKTYLYPGGCDDGKVALVRQMTTSPDDYKGGYPDNLACFISSTSMRSPSVQLN